MKYLLILIVYVLCCMLLSAWCFSSAIDYFKRKRYFLAGMEVILIIMSITNVVMTLIRLHL